MTKISAHSLTSVVGIGSRSHDLVVDDLRILRMSSSDTGSKEDRALLLLFILVRETGTDDFRGTLIFSILSLRKCPKVLSKSIGLI